MNPKKIAINKNDEATFVVEQVLDAAEDAITLAIPRFSKLAESATNFSLLKREAEALGKHIVIESVDDRVIELAKNAGLECINPFFGGSSKQFSDIVMAKKEAHHGSVNKSAMVGENRKVENVAPVHRKTSASPPEAHHREVARKSARTKSYALRSFVAIPVFIGLAVLGWFLGARVLPRADITLASARTNWSYSGNLIVDKEVSAFDAPGVVVPGEKFTEKKNIQLLFPASGKKQVSEKATGVITVFNAHSSEPQGLVKSTRFVAPNGKIYRLTESITVPGAKIEDGKIVPSSIDVKVIADKAGSDYNSGPISKFTIPGISGTPKAETFYGVSTGAMIGGFVGQVAYPSSADLKEAEAAIAETLRSSMHELVHAQLPSDFKVVEGAETFKLISTKIDSQASTEGKFALFSEGELSLMAFREKDVVAMLSDRIKTESGGVDFLVKQYSAVYEKGAFDAKGRFSVPISYEAELARTIDLAAVKSKIRGRGESELRSLIFSLPGLESAKISLWPFWVRRVPQDDDKIRIAVD